VGLVEVVIMEVAEVMAEEGAMEEEVGVVETEAAEVAIEVDLHLAEEEVTIEVIKVEVAEEVVEEVVKQVDVVDENNKLII
jgi:hypothetical protein